MTFRIFLLLFLTTNLTFGQRPGSNITIGRTIQLPSKILNEERQLDIYLPPRYNLTNARYPVVILLDGEQNFLHTVGSSNFLAGTGDLPQLIIVGIPNTNRNRDFTPTATAQNPSGGGAEKFISFMRNELLPNIDHNFRTVPFRILIGNSLCGMFTLYQLVRHGDLFQGYIVISPYLRYDNFLLLNMIRENNIPFYPGHRFLYLAAGPEPANQGSIEDLTGQLKKISPENLIWNFQEDTSGTINSLPLNAVPAGLSFIFNRWPVPESTIESNLDSLTVHFERYSKFYGYNQPVPEDYLNNFAYQIMAEGQIAEALRMFRFNVTNYPDSPNVYDSLGEGLETAGLLAEAAEQYRIAIEKGNGGSDSNLPAYEEHLKRVMEKIDQ
jgi:predicted alpha/beta superfamily hydrolase